jgi:hypothetical protein
MLKLIYSIIYDKYRMNTRNFTLSNETENRRDVLRTSHLYISRQRNSNILRTPHKTFESFCIDWCGCEVVSTSHLFLFIILKA